VRSGPAESETPGMQRNSKRENREHDALDAQVFENLFKYPRVVARHRTGPTAEARERFLNHCVNQGLAKGSGQVRDYRCGGNRNGIGVMIRGL
jgi:hypothetical protein